MYGRKSGSTGRQGAYRNPFNPQTGGVYGTNSGYMPMPNNRSPYAVQTATGGVQTMTNPESSWSMSHRECAPQQQQPRMQQPQYQYSTQPAQNWNLPSRSRSTPHTPQPSYQRQVQQAYSYAPAPVPSSTMTTPTPVTINQASLGVPTELEGIWNFFVF